MTKGRKVGRSVGNLSVVADAIASSAFRFADPDAFRIKLADLIQLHIGQPCRVAMWVRGRRVLSSPSDQELTTSNLGGEDREFARSGSKGVISPWPGFELSCDSLLDGAPLAHTLEPIFTLLRDEEPEAAAEIGGLVALEGTPTPAESTVSRSLTLDAKDLSDRLGPFREVWDRTVELVVEHNSLLRSWGEPPVLSNCFTVVRYVPATNYSRVLRDKFGHEQRYNYTAQILLSRSAQGGLSSIASEIGAEPARLRDSIEAPLGSEGRFISDTVFSTGVLYIADLREREPGFGALQRDLPASPSDHSRHEAEGRFYARFFPGATRAIFVPIHVGGTPWLSLYQFIRPGSWSALFRFYRDEVGPLADRARAAARHGFLTCLARGLGEFARAGGTAGHLKKLNDEWFKASMVFPFPVVSAEIDGEVSNYGLDLGSVRIRVAIDEPARPLPQQVRHEPLTLDDVLLGLKGDAAELALHAANIKWRTDSMAQAVAHEYKNLSTELSTRASDLEAMLRSRTKIKKSILSALKSIAVEGQWLNAISRGLYTLTSTNAADHFETASDASALIHAALRIMLELRRTNDPDISVIGGLTFDEAVELLRATYAPTVDGRDSWELLATLIKEDPVTFLLFAAAEPVRNIRILSVSEAHGSQIQVWTEVPSTADRVLLFQEAYEDVYTNRLPIPSEGAKRVNAILPANFCTILRDVTPVSFTATPRAVLARRVTTIKVFGRPKSKVVVK